MSPPLALAMPEAPVHAPDRRRQPDRAELLRLLGLALVIARGAQDPEPRPDRPTTPTAAPRPRPEA